MDPRSFGCPGSINKLAVLPSKRAFFLPSYYLLKYIFHVKIQIFETRIQIRIRMALDPNSKSEIRIKLPIKLESNPDLDSNPDPQQHWKQRLLNVSDTLNIMKERKILLSFRYSFLDTLFALCIYGLLFCFCFLLQITLAFVSVRLTDCFVLVGLANELSRVDLS
jgi:hypothetical protein